MRFYAYLQRLGARWKPRENINVKAGDGEASPLRALADGGAGVSPRRGAAGWERDERQQRNRLHVCAAGRQCFLRTADNNSNQKLSAWGDEGSADVDVPPFWC